MAQTISTSLQCLKGIAAITVFLEHALGMYQNEVFQAIKQSPFSVFQDGQCAVTIFFMLTGFFCWRETTFTWQKYGKSIWKKAVRIYPAYVLVMIVGWILANMQIHWNKALFTEWCNAFWTEPLTLSCLFKSCSLLLPFTTTAINPPVWYLYVDMRMAFILPILYLIIRKSNIWVGVAMFIGLILFAKGSNPQYWPFYIGGGLLRYLFTHHADFMVKFATGWHKWASILIGIALLDIFWFLQTNYMDAPYWVQGF